jgi:hypothetical protein
LEDYRNNTTLVRGKTCEAATVSTAAGDFNAREMSLPKVTD